jgi:uncharacterized membrane protein YphA (DoxX/SURF4 family)
MNIALWFAQAILAVVFLAAGLMKLTQPKTTLELRPGMSYMTELSAPQLHLIGLAEASGSLGLILPWRLGILPALTPIAAAGLTILMLGAVATHLRRKESPAFTAGLAALAAFVSVGRFGFLS